jgi:general secretion pathway protein G
MHLIPQPTRRQPAASRAFSLVEMLIVIALIALIATLVIGGIDKLFSRSQEDIARQYVSQTLTASLLKFRIDTGSYPTTEEGLKALLTAPAGKAAKWRGPYVDRLRDDPWGRPYQYRYPGTRNKDSYDLWSLGPNPDSEADDIGNWD